MTTEFVSRAIIDLLTDRGPSGLEMIRRKTRAPRRRIDEALAHLLETGAITEHRSPRGGRYWRLTDTPTTERTHHDH